MTQKSIGKTESDPIGADATEVTDDLSDIRIYDLPALTIFVVLFFIVALQFFTRYVLNNSLGWTEEIARYLLILLGFTGSVICVRKGTHIYLEFFYRYLSVKLVKAVAAGAEAVVCGFFFYLGFLGFELAQRTHAQRMVSVDLPKNTIYYIVAICCFAMALFAAFRFYRLLIKPSEEIAAEKLDVVV